MMADIPTTLSLPIKRSLVIKEEWKREIQAAVVKRVSDFEQGATACRASQHCWRAAFCSCGNVSADVIATQMH